MIAFIFSQWFWLSNQRPEPDPSMLQKSIIKLNTPITCKGLLNREISCILSFSNDYFASQERSYGCEWQKKYQERYNK